ncbi:transporter substrate-binding domain-containing protein [Burkholderia sp. AU31624]|uniref:transporter substrate-binding and LysM peptidoglycan-binding domain-containing protein n=1 Tax=Burkholderia sp. AU31624 TaxID=2879629 RepID=UPI001CF0F56C|nr:transporter substrate-binding domain-containing protein [Burkholderia sp. AU31624]MCA8251892.1 transporter substrate-binding domain-containing protein [Burkholderia sp. AU31624]
MKKLLGAIAFLVVLVGVWIVHQGGLSTLIPAHDAAPASTSAQGGDSGPSTQASPSANVLPAGFTPQASALKSIAENGIVRISVQNPSEPFFGEDKGTPHGFNVEFARLLFADPSFSHGGKPVVVDTRHEVDTYPGVPKQLLDTDAKGNHVVDVAMDGLTFPDNTPSGVVYSVPYVDDFGYSLIVRQGSAIRSTDDLAGKTVGILKGDPDVRAFVTRQYPNVKFVEVDDSDPAFIAKSIDGHAVDAFIYDYPFAVSSIKDTDLKFAVTKLDGSNIAYKIGVRADDQDLLIYLNAAIAKLKQSPQYLDLLRKYFVSDQAVTTAAASGEHTYVVKAGDTLNMIAASKLGSGQRYREIQRRNNLANPNLILAGQHLVIPVR